MTNAISANGLALIQEYEGFQAQPTFLSDGVWVVGYSHVRVGDPGPAVNQNEATDLLTIDLAPFEKLVNARVTEMLTQSQFDALVSFAFSVGAEAFEKSQVLRRVNANDHVAAACAMDAWRKCEVGGELTVDGALVRRRAAEKALFLKETAKNVAPSAAKRAQLDYAASVLGAPASPKKVELAQTTTPVAATQPKLELVVANDAPLQSVPRDMGVTLTEILKSEPATELLLTQLAPANDFDLEDEIVTAHAKPVARTLDSVREATRRDFEAKLATRKQKRGLAKLFSRNVSNKIEPAQPGIAPDRRIREVRAMGDVKPSRFELPTFETAGSFENFGLYALLVFGLGLVALGASLLVDGAGDIVGVVGAAALVTPGLAATLMAVVGLRRLPRPFSA